MGFRFNLSSIFDAIHIFKKSKEVISDVKNPPQMAQRGPDDDWIESDAASIQPLKEVLLNIGSRINFNISEWGYNEISLDIPKAGELDVNKTVNVIINVLQKTEKGKPVDNAKINEFANIYINEYYNPELNNKIKQELEEHFATYQEAIKKLEEENGNNNN